MAGNSARFPVESVVLGDIRPEDRDFFVLIETNEEVPIRKGSGITDILNDIAIEWINEVESSGNETEYFPSFNLERFKRDIRMPRTVRAYVFSVEGIDWEDFRRSPFFQIMLNRLSEVASISHIFVSSGLKVFDNFYLRQVYFRDALEREITPSDMSLACLECGGVITLPTHQNSINDEAAALIDLHREISPHCPGDLSFHE